MIFFASPSAVWGGEGGWGAVVGSGRAALSLSWMIWRRSPTQHFPARRMSSAKPSRSPRISKSCCERLRRTNMTGQDLKRNSLSGLVFFSFLFFAVISNSDFLLHSWLFCYLFSCVYLLSFPLFFVCYLHSSSPHSTSTLLRCFDVVLVSRCPRPFTPVSRPCEREGVRRLRHSLGCFSTLVPWAEKAPTPLQPLSLRSPDPTSWYSGLCPCLPGTVLFSSPSLCLGSFSSVSPANKLSSFSLIVVPTFMFFSWNTDFEFASACW